MYATYCSMCGAEDKLTNNVISINELQKWVVILILNTES